MLKKLFLTALLLSTSAYAADTRPTLATIKECTPPKGSDPIAVKVGFTVQPDGKLTDMHVITSSGNTDVDEHVMKCVAGYVFKPATHDGVAVAAPDTFEFHQARLEDMTGDRYAFGKLERDADRRCHKLFPINRNFLTGNTISLVGVHRKEGGAYQLAILQSANATLDEKAIACLNKILPDHEELPATFTRAISVDWSHR